MKQPGRFWKGLGLFLIIIAGIAALMGFIAIFVNTENRGLGVGVLASSLGVVLLGLMLKGFGDLLNDAHASKVFLANLLRIKLEERGEEIPEDVKTELK